MRPLPKRGQLFIINGIYVLMMGDHRVMSCYARAKCFRVMQLTMPQWIAGNVSLGTLSRCKSR
jgi:hypothetical protein